MKKGIGLGIEDFREIIKEDCYYFDKTNYIEELIAPKRVVTSTVKIKNALDKRCPVKTEKSIPKELNFKLMDELKNIELTAPVKRGDIVIKNVFNTGVNVVVTKDM